jgi:hypothetical protein
MQIFTQAQFFLFSIINTKIFDNCANKQKDNRMNNDDNDKTQLIVANITQRYKDE